MTDSASTPLDSGTDRLLVHADSGIGYVTFNNPDRHNALSLEMRTALPGVLRALQDHPDVRVLVVRGAGDKAFMSGADISEFGEQRTSPDARADYERQLAETAEAWAAVDKPIIAMVRGYCIGGGLLVAMQADVRIASEDSQFAVPAARLGLGYGYGGVKALVDLVGPAWTSEILFTGRRLSAAEALHIGLVNRVVPASELEAEVTELAGAIQSNAPLTVSACKAAIREARRDPDRRDLGRVAELVEACFRSEDYLEGQRAFQERRPPRFTGR
ncbi:MAG TPA: enoyl-CoA hydratase [Acidimicrobiales bacterium]|nr:enoyl-CoA hydratase [Acidimicrobiales bacterium]